LGKEKKFFIHKSYHSHDDDHDANHLGRKAQYQEGAEVAADERADQEHIDGVDDQVSSQNEYCRRDHVDDQGQHAAQSLELLDLEGQAEGHHGEQQDPHAGAEVAAVDRHDEDADEESPAPGAVRVIDVRQALGNEGRQGEQ
jgi:hypothetical protein